MNAKRIFPICCKPLSVIKYLLGMMACHLRNTWKKPSILLRELNLPLRRLESLLSCVITYAKERHAGGESCRAVFDAPNPAVLSCLSEEPQKPKGLTRTRLTSPVPKVLPWRVRKDGGNLTVLRRARRTARGSPRGSPPRPPGAVFRGGSGSPALGPEPVRRGPAPAVPGSRRQMDPHAAASRPGRPPRGAGLAGSPCGLRGWRGGGNHRNHRRRQQQHNPGSCWQSSLKRHAMEGVA